MPNSFTPRWRVLAALAGVLVVSTFARTAEEGFKPLFNGSDLTGWTFFVSDGTPPEKIWSARDGAIICTGKPNGYIYTTKSFSNYVLRFDWRYPAGSKPESNSGCLLHIQPPHKIWPQSVESQGRYKDHGKLFIFGLPKDQIMLNEYSPEEFAKVVKPMGEWNSTEVTCGADGSVSVKVNGTPVSKGKTVLKSGPIGFQSEGTEVHFKNLAIREAK